MQYQLFGGDLPIKLAGDYRNNANLQEDALDLMDRALDALSNTTTLFAALDPDGTGIFDHYDSDGDGTADSDFIYYDANDRRWETRGNNRTLAQFLGERQHEVITGFGSTSYTRFGFWRRESTKSAERQPTPAVVRDHGGPARSPTVRWTRRWSATM